MYKVHLPIILLEGLAVYKERKNTHPLSGTPTITEISTTWNRFSAELRDSSTVTISERTPGCVTNMIQSLGLESLQHSRYINRLTMLFKIQHGNIDISPDFVQLNDQHTRGSKRLRQLPATNDAYKFSFYPRTIIDWNRSPAHITDLQSPQGFRDALANLHPTLHMSN